MSKKFLLPFIFFSLLVHLLVIGFTFQIDLPERKKANKVINVEIKSVQDTDKPFRQKVQRPLLPKIKKNRETSLLREASVDLGKPGGVYEKYLDRLRRKIERFWLYPPGALAKRVEGEAVIRFSINAKGGLAESLVVSSSGSALLDEGALDSVRNAAPFEPLPAAYNLSFLHITATFSYRIATAQARY